MGWTKALVNWTWLLVEGEAHLVKPADSLMAYKDGTKCLQPLSLQSTEGVGTSPHSPQAVLLGMEGRWVAGSCRPQGYPEAVEAEH